MFAARQRTYGAVYQAVPPGPPLSEPNHGAVKLQYAVPVPFLVFCAVLRIFPAHGQPWCCFRKPAVAPAGPWERCPGIIAASQVDDLKRLLFTEAFLQGTAVLVYAGYVVKRIQGTPFKIHHSQLLPLVQEGGSPQEEIHGCQHLDSTGIFCCLLQIFGCRSGLIMVFDEVGPPSIGLDSHLACHDFILKLFHCPFPSLKPFAARGYI